MRTRFADSAPPGSPIAPHGTPIRPCAGVKRRFRAVEQGGCWIGLDGDCPELTPEILRQGLQALDHHEVVLGPSQHGGYYLVGGRVPLPDIFSDMPWNTDRLLAETRSRLADAGVAWSELPALREVESVADARAAGLLT